MKKNLVLVLSSVLLVVMLSGCGVLGALVNANEFVGTWETTVDLTDSINKEIESVGVAIDEFEITLVYTFNIDGTYKAEPDMDALENSFNALIDQLVDEMEKVVQGYGMSVADYEAQAGISLRDAVKATYNQEMLDTLADGMTSEGNFKAEDGKLFMSDGLENGIDEEIYETYEMDGDEFRLLTAVGQNVDESIYPMIFKKVK